MERFAKYFCSFFIDASGALALAALSFVDPLDALRALNVDLSYKWTISPDERRAMFLVLAFLWMFVWYFRKRASFEDDQPPEPNLPLHHACRWIARDSIWAAKLNPQFDEQWVSMVSKELEAKVAQGRVELFAERWPHHGNSEAMRPIPADIKSGLRWEPEKMVFDEPPTLMWTDNAVFHRVMLDDNQVRKIWPRKSFWARLKKRSPIERIGGREYIGKFAAQDKLYSENHGFTATPLNAFV